MDERIEMTVKMQVTIPQALTLQSMFDHWNRLASIGSSRMIGFYVDGDGNFHPDCVVSFSETVPELTTELREATVSSRDGNEMNFDFDGVAWKMRELGLRK